MSTATNAIILSVVMPDGTLHPYHKEPNDPVPEPDGDPAHPTDVA